MSKKFDFIEYMETRAVTEEDVKYAYTKKFDLDFSTRNRNDLITENVLFEFKYNKKLTNEVARSIVIAQSLIYIHRIKYEDQGDKMPAYFVIADKNEAAIYKTADFQSIYDNEKFNWDMAASHPPEDLCTAVHSSSVESLVYDVSSPIELQEFSDKLNKILNDEEVGDKKVITEYNFDSVFEIWKTRFGEFIDNEKKLSKFFISDILGNTTLDEKRGTVVFRFNGAIKEASIPVSDYKAFWNTYHYMDDAIAQQSMYSKSDRLDNIDKRRFIGKFYTPLRFAKLAIKYLEDEYGKRFWERYKIWDMACGTGNLEYYLGSYENVYMSTLEQNEIDDMANNNLFPSATLFQYDYLNDDVDLVMSKADLLDDSLGWKLPRKLREDLANPDNKWIVLINPPYASFGGGTNYNRGKEKIKKGISSTQLAEYIKKSDINSSELFVQFLFRITTEITELNLGLFASLKYLNGPSEKGIRKKINSSLAKNGGFLFSSENFHGTAGKWPVSFILWNSNTVNNDKIFIYDDNARLCGEKYIIEEKEFLSSFIQKSSITNKKEFVVGTTALNVFPELSYMDEEAIGTFDFHANKMSNKRQTSFSSLILKRGPARGKSIFKSELENIFIVFVARHIINKNWINNRDYYKLPKSSLPSEFTNDSALWSLFNSSNQSSALKDVEVEGKVFQVRNQFYPFGIEEVQQWTTKNLQIYSQLRNQEDRFVAKWLNDKELSKEAQDVLDAGRKIYQLYYEEYNNLNRKKFKLDYWDVGWYQIRRSLEDKKLGTELFKSFKEKYKILTEKLRPKIYEYGFLDKEVVYG